MMKLVDSSKEQLPMHDIIQGALEREGYGDKSKEDLAGAYLAIVQEMNMPDALIRQFGNSLLIAHINDGKSFFRILNMDTAPNLLENSTQVIKYMTGDLGLAQAVTTYKGESLRGLVKAATKRAYERYPEFMHKFEILKGTNGDDVVVFYLEQ
jgi:hypothetical protein